MGHTVKRLLTILLASALLAACSSVELPSLAEKEQPPYAEGIEVGKKYDYVLSTHCGIVQARIDGSWWEADPPLVNGGSPPAGWDNPMAGGTLRLLSDDRAEFVDGDRRATFRRADAPPKLCK